MSRAAALALTAYHTVHLKFYSPAEFYVGLLNNQPMGFYSPAVIAGDAKRHGVAILPVDVNASFAKAVVEGEGMTEGPLGAVGPGAGLEGFESMRSPEGPTSTRGPSVIPSEERGRAEEARGVPRG